MAVQVYKNARQKSSGKRVAQVAAWKPPRGGEGQPVPSGGSLQGRRARPGCGLRAGGAAPRRPQPPRSRRQPRWPHRPAAAPQGRPPSSSAGVSANGALPQCRGERGGSGSGSPCPRSPRRHGEQAAAIFPPPPLPAAASSRGSPGPAAARARRTALASRRRESRQSPAEGGPGPGLALTHFVRQPVRHAGGARAAAAGGGGDSGGPERALSRGGTAACVGRDGAGRGRAGARPLAA